MIRKTLVLAMGLATALPALSDAMAEEAKAEVTAEVAIEISDEEALEDDILLMIDLPIVVADARDAGVDEEELDDVIDTANKAGVSAGTVAEMVLAEVETTKAKGKRKGLHVFVRRQLAKGTTPREIAKKVKDREEILEDMTEEERAELEAKIDEMRDLNMRRRKARHAKRKELIDNHGQKVKLIAHEAHQQRKKALMERKVELEKARQHHKAAKKDHKEAKKDLHDAKKDLKAADTPEEKKAAAQDLKDAKKELHEEKKELHEEKKDLHDAKKDDKKAGKKAAKKKAEKKAEKKAAKKGGPGGKKGKAGGPGGKKKGG